MSNLVEVFTLTDFDLDHNLPTSPIQFKIKHELFEWKIPGEFYE